MHRRCLWIHGKCTQKLIQQRACMLNGACVRAALATRCRTCNCLDTMSTTASCAAAYSPQSNIVLTAHPLTLKSTSVLELDLLQTLTQCKAGFGDCDNTASNGCEATLSNDITNCGSCTHTCIVPANADPTCTGGTCGFAVSFNIAIHYHSVIGNLKYSCQFGLAYACVSCRYRL
jgi:hypothetical protein